MRVEKSIFAVDASMSSINQSEFLTRLDGQSQADAVVLAQVGAWPYPVVGIEPLGSGRMLEFHPGFGMKISSQRR